MTMFTSAQVAYLESQRLGRLATIGGDGQPHVVPVRYRYNSELDTIDVGGHGFGTSKKYRDAQRNPRVALVVDDVAPGSPRVVRGVEIRGEAEALASGGDQIWPDVDPEMVRIRVRHVASWGLGSEDGGSSSAS